MPLDDCTLVVGDDVEHIDVEVGEGTEELGEETADHVSPAELPDRDEVVDDVGVLKRPHRFEVVPLQRLEHFGRYPRRQRRRLLHHVRPLRQSWRMNGPGSPSSRACSNVRPGAMAPSGGSRRLDADGTSAGFSRGGAG